LEAEESARQEREAERKRKQREERLRQRSLYNTAQLTKTDNEDPNNFIAIIEEDPEEEEQDLKNEKDILSAGEEEEDEDLPPPVQIDEIPAVIEIKLSEEELAKLEAERKQQEEEEKKETREITSFRKRSIDEQIDHGNG